MRTLIPPFLKKQDQFLLTNYPFIRETKAHILLPAFGLIAGWLWIYIQFRQIDALAGFPNYWNLFRGLLVVPFLAWLYMGIRASLHFSETDFAFQSFRRHLSVFGLVLLISFAYFSLPYLGTSWLMKRFQEEIPLEEVVQDVNTLNKGVKFFSGVEYYPKDKSGEYLEPFYSYVRFYLKREGLLTSADLRPLDQPSADRDLLIAELENFRRVLRKWGENLSINPAKTVDNYRMGKVHQNSLPLSIKNNVNNRLKDWQELSVSPFEKFGLQWQNCLLAGFLGCILIWLAMMMSSRRLLYFLATLAGAGTLGFLLLFLYHQFIGSSTEDIFKEVLLSFWLIALVGLLSQFRKPQKPGLAMIFAGGFAIGLVFLPFVLRGLVREYVTYLRPLYWKNVLELGWMGVALFMLIGFPIMHRIFRRLRSQPGA